MVALLHFSDPAPLPQVDRPAEERAIGPAPERTTWERYAADGGAISMGEWACEPGAWRIRFHPRRHEFFCVQQGRIRITSTLDGGMREYGPGDAAVIPAGFVGIFEVLEPVRKYYVMLDWPPAA